MSEILENKFQLGAGTPLGCQRPTNFARSTEARSKWHATPKLMTESYFSPRDNIDHGRAGAAVHPSSQQREFSRNDRKYPEIMGGQDLDLLAETNEKFTERGSDPPCENHPNKKVPTVRYH